MLPVLNASQQVLTHSLHETLYVQSEQVSLGAVVDVLHKMAGRPDARYMISHNYHPDNVALLRLLPSDTQLRGSGLQQVVVAIKTFEEFNSCELGVFRF